MKSDSSVSRRDMLLAAGAATVGSILRPSSVFAERATSKPPPFRCGLNMSTIRGQKPSLGQEIDIAGKAGYDSIEPWLGKIHKYVEKGGSLKDIRKRIEDNGLTVESAIGFAQWAVDDEEKRKRGFENAKRDMDVLSQIGAVRIAAPPAGATRPPALDLMKVGERYAELLKVGEDIGVIPQVEIWGGTATLGHWSQAAFVAVASGHPKACMLGDVYHLFRGGSDFDSLLLFSAQALQTFHFNDYPADPPRQEMRDHHRVYPGDGVAPIKKILQNFRATGASPVLSLELFNRDYWKQDVNEVAKTGLMKMKKAVAEAMSNE
jgi:sugar phosphate isomerase/epimerase